MARALILAAGRGERMRPLTDTTPKPLLRAGGRPLIEWQIERLVLGGFDELVINHSHLGTQLEEALGDGRRLGAKLRYSHEASALEGRVASLLDDNAWDRARGPVRELRFLTKVVADIDAMLATVEG